ncbi:lipopolysaccharide biosynthesis protein [Sphingobacterium deserti]|uniref:Polysaccharide biosynthesis protein n=1 Tax=Sphingobacterium deserti TaxID=1229276 RepID=A0A0B8T7F2_9SPHI|nr:lipopolysaccharide biosynthesis protein [Sphingobacterium deserti]KGE14394.1 polysaccharide biosynthesis protein [Sphingobacterium deserti]
MSENTKQNTLKGLFWNAIDRFGNQFVITVVGIITARILTPNDFGVLAVLMIFSTIATTFVDSGLATSLVRSPKVEEEEYATMFVFNLAVSVLLYGILFFAAPYLERFNDIEGLALYARVLFLQLIVHSFGIVQYVKLLKNFSFKQTARINVFAIVFSGTTVVSLALLGFGVWAILLQPVLYSSFRTAMLWLWGDWKINLSFSFDVLKKHLRFSVSFMVGSMLGKVFSQGYYAFIGKHFSLAETGFYLQANKWGETPNMLISSVIQGTTLSTLTPIQDDYPRFLNACRKSMKTLGFLLFPVSLCAIAIAEPAFTYFLSDKWAASICYFQLLCFAGMFISLTDLNVNFLNIKGKSDYTLWLEVIKIATAVAVLLATFRFGILSIIFGQIGIRIAFYCVSTFFSGKIYGYHFFRQLRDLSFSFFISVVAFCLAMLFSHFFPNIHDLILLSLQSIIFVMVYIVGNHLGRNEIWMELVNMGKRKLARK